MSTIRSAPTGATELYGVIGDPVRHSLSPVLHNAAFAALDVDAVYVALPVARGSGAAAVAAMRTLGISGLNVTMPHKEDVAGACDELTDDASRLGVVNTVALLTDGRVLGDSTDGEGLLRSLADEQVAVDGRRIVIVGAGGAARAVALALGRRGAELTVLARRSDQAEVVARLAPNGRSVVLGDTPGVTQALRGADVVVNATPIGMTAADGGALPVPIGELGRDSVVVDLIYHPAETPWLALARAQGLRAVNGLGMLLHQAALACERWTGQPAPVEAMRRAALAELARR
jgi:shikimate dehydrogenase